MNDREHSVVARPRSSSLESWQKTIIICVAIVALAVAVPIVASAAIPNAKGTYHACMNKKSGVVRLIDPSKKQVCNKTTETRISWNKTGPTGPAGAAAPTPIKFDFAVPFDGQGPIHMIGAGLRMTSFCSSTGTILSISSTPAANTLRVGGVAFSGDTASIRDLTNDSVVLFTSSNPSKPVHFSGTIQNVAVGGIYQLDLHMSPVNPCRVWGSATLLG
jgi:hypothetical protein